MKRENQNFKFFVYICKVMWPKNRYRQHIARRIRHMAQMTNRMEQGMQRRTERLLGKDTLDRIRQARVLIFGVGGVGSWCAECLVRSGIRHLTIVDSDRVCMTNCNRQLMATSRTIGQIKVEVLRERLLDINPTAEITALQQIYNAETAESFHIKEYDFVIDAIDSLTEKAHLILHTTNLPSHVTLISSMGAALRIDPFRVRKAEFWKVKGDALARALRNKFKCQGVFPKRKFLCVYSEEPAMSNLGIDYSCGTQQCVCHSAQKGFEQNRNTSKAQINGSLCHITAIFGMSIAGIVIGKLCEEKEEKEEVSP